MNTLKELLEKIASTPDCVVHPACGLPVISQEFSLLPELREFYTLCGGIEFYRSSIYSMQMVPPDEFVPANKEMFAGVAQADLAAIKGDRSTYWFIIGKAAPHEFIVIDFDEKHLGKYYEGFWDSYADPGCMPVVALSLHDLLNNLYANRGEYWYWLRSDFISLGDAYD